MKLKSTTGTALLASGSSACQNLLLVSDNNCVFNLFDLRQNSRLGIVKTFKGSEDLPISLDFEDNQFVIGTSEGPFTFDLKKMTTDFNQEDQTMRTKLQDMGVFTKSMYSSTSSNNLIYSEIGGSTINLVENFGEQNQFQFEVLSTQRHPFGEHGNADQENRIIDFDVCKESSEAAVLYTSSVTQQTNLQILDIDKTTESGFRLREDIQVGNKGVRVNYTRDKSLFVLTEEDWNIYNTHNSHFVKQLASKVERNHKSKQQ